MLPGEPGGGRTPEGVGPRVNDTRRRAGAEIGRRSRLPSQLRSLDIEAVDRIDDEAPGMHQRTTRLRASQE
jgi:hypothetical protein